MPEPKRNPERVIAAIRKAIKINPGERVTQLIQNAVFDATKNQDIFYVEDDALADAIERYSTKDRSTQSFRIM